MNIYSEFLKKQDCVLVIVDIQKSMLNLCAEPDLVRKNTEALIDIARISEIPVIFSEHNADKLGDFLPELMQKVPDSSALNKVEFSCFENENLSRAIRENRRNTLILAGIETHVCIFHTGAHGIRLGYNVHVISDAVSSRSRQNKEIGLRRLEKAGAVISSTEMAIFELLNRADTPEFRQALPIIKSL
ncbi:MAG: isochorismatase family protein [Desulfobacterales bacterium]|nr:isochorismatase family protein [Desulfobacterales bacterium]